MSVMHSANSALLKLLVKAGVLTGELALAAEADLAKDPGSAIDWLTRSGVSTEEELARTLAKELHLPFVNLPAQALSPAVTSLIKEDIATKSGIVPLRASDGSLVVAVANPFDREALRSIEFSTGRRVHVEVATQTAVRDAIGHAYHLDDALNSYLQGIPSEGDEVPIAEITDAKTDVRGLLHESTLPPVVKLLNLILMEGIRSHASDVHIEPSVSGVRVRYRIDGILEESFRLPKWIQDPLIARCKVLAKLDITERRVPQDGRINIRCRDAFVDLRVSSLPTQFGEKVTMRILDPAAAPEGLAQFGLSEAHLKAIRHALSRPEGMILVTGPTGSGKTTTLYGMLAELISPARNIVTIENPIEYQLRGVNQVEINERQGLTFAGTLRAILRQDPDVILVGEIRDTETAEIALRAAQTGHLVLSTLHTNDAVATITRLTDLGVEPYMLASTLHLIIAQRLVRQTCQRCATPYEPDPMALRALQINVPGHRFMHGGGCPACRKSGFAGRLGVFEVMSISRQMATLMESKAPEGALRTQARSDGTKPLAENAVQLVLRGISTVEEVLRVVDVVPETARCPACEKAIEEAFTVCPHCATPLRCTCPSCGMTLQKEWQLCPYCGDGSKAAGGPTSPASPHTVPPPHAPPPAVAARSYRALVVDDAPDMRHLATHTLQTSGLPLAVIEACDGQQALALAEENPPDLILLDIMMPIMDGFEVCERLRANVRTAFIPILMLTARDDAESRARGFMAGTDDYISKPFARAELLARVRRLLERTYGATLPEDPAAHRKLHALPASTLPAQLSA